MTIKVQLGDILRLGLAEQLGLNYWCRNEEANRYIEVELNNDRLFLMKDLLKDNK